MSAEPIERILYEALVNLRRFCKRQEHCLWHTDSILEMRNAKSAIDEYERRLAEAKQNSAEEW